jgi:hypothetical protein
LEIDDAKIVELRLERMDFLDAFDSPELMELEGVASFLDETSTWTALGEGLFSNHLAGMSFSTKFRAVEYLTFLIV